MYTIDSTDNYYIVKKNGVPISLIGVGLLRFDDKEDAERYIRLIGESEYQIKMGVPE